MQIWQYFKQPRQECVFLGSLLLLLKVELNTLTAAFSHQMFLFLSQPPKMIIRTAYQPKISEAGLYSTTLSSQRHQYKVASLGRNYIRVLELYCFQPSSVYSDVQRKTAALHRSGMEPHDVTKGTGTALLVSLAGRGSALDYFSEHFMN